MVFLCVNGMDAFDAILSRRSIRKYSKQQISPQVIHEILEAGMSAPSAGNEQPWHFIVLSDPQILRIIPSFHSHAQMLKDAMVAILVCGDLFLEKHKGMWVQDCSAATENMLIAIVAKGLGGVWLGVYPQEERMNGLRDLLHIPDHVIPFSLVSIGYPAEQKPLGNRYDDLRVHSNKW